MNPPGFRNGSFENQQATLKPNELGGRVTEKTGAMSRGFASSVAGAIVVKRRLRMDPGQPCRLMKHDGNNVALHRTNRGDWLRKARGFS
jgi:hypothetical protein